jgi:hypothetical protein
MAISPADLDALSNDVTGLMLDRCVILTWQAGAQDDRGMPVVGYVAGAEIPCSFRDTSRREAQGEAQAATVQATVKLPLPTAVTTRDRIRLTWRYGRLLDTPEVLDITNLRRGMVQWTCEVARATGATVEVV